MNIVSLLNVSFLHLEHTRKSCECDIDNIQLCHVPGCITHTHTHTCVCHYYRVPGEIKRTEVELDPQVSPEENMNKEVELGCESWTSFASGCSSTAVQRTLSLIVTLPSTAVEPTIA